MGVYNDRGITGVSSVTRATDDGHVMDLRMTRDGTPFSAEWLLGLAMEGRVFNASAGALTTPITWTSTATIDGTKAAFFLSAPAGTCVIPVSIALYMEAFGTTAQFEVMAAVGTGGVSAGGSAVTIQNLRSDAPYTSNCTVTSDLTGATYMTTNIAEFWRDGQQFAITKSAGSATAAASDPIKFEWTYVKSKVAPILIGAAQLGVFIGSQAGTGFCTVQWVEIPTTSVTG
jgi:hypothetical protein